MSDVARIAAGLTKAQRKAVLQQLTGEWTVRTGQGHGHTRMLYFLLLAEMKRVPDAYPERTIPIRRAGVAHRLTDLGLAVRAHLLSENPS